MTALTEELFSLNHRRQIEAHGLTVTQVLEQLECFRSGVAPIRLNRPCRVGDGITSIKERDVESYIRLHEQAGADGRFMKFVPASGAATRMFREWFVCLESGRFETDAAAQTFAATLGKFAFYEDLNASISRKGHRLAAWISQGRYQDIVAEILTGGGLNYGHLPKALLKFHRYPSGNHRSALEEHLVEAALYVQDRNRICRVHFTVSDTHRRHVEHCLLKVRERYEKEYHVHYNVAVSVQGADTDTLAVDMQNNPFLDHEGNLVLRPGGHGALLSNLDELADGDVVYVKNIDNVVPDHLKALTVLYKKILGGYLIALQEQIFGYVQRLERDQINEGDLGPILEFCREKLCLEFPSRFSDLSFAGKRDMVLERLRRPIRVCGMVRNEGEPGGGPFWVDGEEGTQSLQIVEEHQIDPISSSQRSIWSQATHFNPVDLVCGIRDQRGEKFDLKRLIDHKTFSIVKKSEKGRDLLALEHPGFWNGGMALWITVFVEVPLETFNPVKTVNDLLRPAHQMDWNPDRGFL